MDTGNRGMAAAGALALATLSLGGLVGCSASYEGSGSKDAASAEQLAVHTPNTWTERPGQSPIGVEGTLEDGVYTGESQGMAGMIGVTLLVQDNHITCLEITQGGGTGEPETQSVGGYEAIRDGVYAQMIEDAQGFEIDTVSGATITTIAVREAAREALAEAGATTHAVPSTAGSATSAQTDGEAS